VVLERLREAILNQITKDRNNEYVDLDLIKRSINTFVEMGYTSAVIVKSDNEFIWKGEKHNDIIYVKKFQIFLIAIVIKLLFYYYFRQGSITLKKVKHG